MLYSEPRALEPKKRRQATVFIMMKNNIKEISREWAQGELLTRILAPPLVNGAYDESVGSYAVFCGYDPATLLSESKLPDLSRSTPKREVAFVAFDFTEFSGLGTLHDHKSSDANVAKKFYGHVYDQSLALEKFISMVKRVTGIILGFLVFFGPLVFLPKFLLVYLIPVIFL